MRFPVVTPLLQNPWLAVMLGLVGFFNLLAVIVAAGLASSTRAIGGEFDVSKMLLPAALAGSIYGAFIGAALIEVARCSCSWSLPGLRRRSAVDFISIGGGIAVALSGLMAAVGLVTPGMAFHAAALVFAAYAIGGVTFLCPEGTLVLVLAFPLWILTALGVWNPRRLLPTDLWHLTAGALALSVIAIVVAFGTRTYRWAAQTPGSPWGGRTVWETLPTLPWWPRRRRCVDRVATGPERPAMYVGLGVWRGATQAYRASRPSFRIVQAIGPIVYVATGLACFTWSPSERSVPWWTLLWYSPLLLQLDDGPAFEQMPWPRQHLLKVSYAGDLVGTLLFLFVQGAAMTALFAWAGPNGTPPATVATVVVATAAALPLAQWWFRTHGGWRRRRSSLVILSILGWLALGLAYVPVVAFGLPWLLRDPGLEIAAYGILIVVSQILHWRRLHRYFSTGDLVGTQD